MCITHYGLHAKSGLTRRVPIERVRVHVSELCRNGWRYRDIHTATGVSEDTLYRIMGSGRRRKDRPTRSVRRATAERILALPVSQRDLAVVPGVGTVRRARGMARQGWPMRWQAEQCGLHPHTLQTLSWRDAKAVTYRTHRAIADLCDRVCMDIGPDRRIAVWAENKGWAPLMAWDDIDDPRARPTRVRKAKQ